MANKETETSKVTKKVDNKDAVAITPLETALKNAEKAAPTESYKGNWDDQMKNLTKDILNRKAFSYDFNADPLYQNYKDQYVQAGQMAMQDTMGEAAALSGGYGSSYATTAGNQAYQQYLTQLNNVIPELYNAAYTRYNNDGETMRNNLAMLQGMDNIYYGRWQDQNALWQDKRNYAYQKYRDGVSDNQWQKELYVNDAHWVDEMNEKIREFDKSAKQTDEEFQWRKENYKG